MGTHGHRRMLCFLPLLQLPPVAPFCTSRLRSAGLTWPLKNITFLALRSEIQIDLFYCFPLFLD